MVLLIQSTANPPQYLCWWVMAVGRHSPEVEWQQGTVASSRAGKGWKLFWAARSGACTSRHAWRSACGPAWARRGFPRAGEVRDLLSWPGPLMYPQKWSHGGVQARLWRTWKTCLCFQPELPIHLDITHQLRSLYQLRIREFLGTVYYITLLFSLITLKCQTCALFANSLLHKSVYLHRISPLSHTGKANANSLYFIPQMLFFHTCT